MIIEYRQCQMILIQTLAPPKESLVDLTSPLEILHTISP
jgi:hypothetical protein